MTTGRINQIATNTKDALLHTQRIITVVQRHSTLPPCGGQGSVATSVASVQSSGKSTQTKKSGGPPLSSPQELPWGVYLGTK